MLPKRRGSRGLLRLGHLSALNWVLLGYAVVVVAIGWTYGALRIHADYERTLEGERNRLRDVTTALQSGMLAMLSDGSAQPLRGANELQSSGGPPPVQERESARRYRFLCGAMYPAPCENRAHFDRRRS
jgi:hypothetical protein